VPDANGINDSWQVELNSPNNLKRQGWKSTSVKPGDQVTAGAESAQRWLEGRFVRIYHAAGRFGARRPDPRPRWSDQRSVGALTRGREFPDAIRSRCSRHPSHVGAVDAGLRAPFRGDVRPDPGIKVTGAVTEFQWTNPHASFKVDVLGDDGKTETWSIEMNGPNNLARPSLLARASVRRSQSHRAIR